MYYPLEHDKDLKTVYKLWSDIEPDFDLMLSYAKFMESKTDDSDVITYYRTLFKNVFLGKFKYYKLEDFTDEDDFDFTDEHYKSAWENAVYLEFVKYQSIYEDRLWVYHTLDLDDITKGMLKKKSSTTREDFTSSKASSVSSQRQGSVSDSVMSSNKEYELPQVTISGQGASEDSGNISYKEDNTNARSTTDSNSTSSMGSDNIIERKDFTDNTDEYLGNQVEEFAKLEKHVANIMLDFVSRFKNTFRLVF